MNETEPILLLFQILQQAQLQGRRAGWMSFNQQAWSWCYRPAALTLLGYETLYLFLALCSASQRNINLERSSWAWNTSNLPNMLVKICYELTKLCFNDDQVLHHHYSIPDLQYTDEEKYFIKSCLSVFPVVSMWIIFFDLKSFSFPISPEFSITMCLQGIITFISSFRKTKASPCFSLPHLTHRLSSAARPFFMNGDATSLNAISTPLETVIRDILSLDLPFMVESHWWQYSSWLARWPSAFYWFPFPADKVPFFWANSPH